MTGHTVLILGAGASFAYGLPLGKGLVERIIELLPSNANTRMSDRALALHNQLENIPAMRSWLIQENKQLVFVLLAFRQRLIESDPKSIDEFLSRDFGSASAAFQWIGKLSIAYVISECESEAEFQYSDLQANKATSLRDHWYQYLWQDCLNKDVRTLDELRAKKLRIVSFNYDRSLEHFLGKRIAATYLTDPLTSLDPTSPGRWATPSFVEVEKNLQITHPYGTLGSLVEFPYGNSNNRRDHGPTMADRIKVIAEDRDDKGFDTARKWIDEAATVVFLGFSFDSTNMRLLGLENGLRGKLKAPGVHGQKALFPLTYGLARAERLNLHQKYFSDFYQAETGSISSPGNDRLPISEMHKELGITAYLRQYGALAAI